jgi:cysteinyl-tRNA synthetase
MSLRFYDTLTRAKRDFVSLQPGRVRMYNCGPTVYGRPHIGNLRAFLFADLLRRWLELRGFEVQQVMNITDVGHLVADAEEGEDKLQAQARREKLDPWAIAKRYSDEFFEDLKALGVRPARLYPRASEHIPEMLALIESLLAQGYAYQVGSDVYFDVSKFPRYGRLSGNRVEALEAGARIEVRSEKRHPADFALWKSDPQHLMKWTSRFGEHGFPGWHIECSAMAFKHLGQELDIHTGGEDNIFPHHECEIAQSEAVSGRPFARFWMHSKFLTVDGGKMSKSLGNVYSLPDVLARGYSVQALRFVLLRGHYRQPLDFTWATLDEAKSALAGLEELTAAMRARLASGAVEAAGSPVPVVGAAAQRGPAESSAPLQSPAPLQPGAATGSPGDPGLARVARARAEFEAALDDDLAVPEALAALFSLRSEVIHAPLSPAATQAVLDLLALVDAALGILLPAAQPDAEIEALVAARQAARAAKNWAEADRLRKELDGRGIVLQDSPQGVLWHRK